MSENVKSFQIVPNNLSNEVMVGGTNNFQWSANRYKRILKIFKILAENNAFDGELNILKENGEPNTTANISELLELTQRKQDRLDGLDDFVNQLIKSNIDLNLIINNNIRERLRAAKETHPQPPPTPPENQSRPPTPPGEGGVGGPEGGLPPPPPPQVDDESDDDDWNIGNDDNNNNDQPPDFSHLDDVRPEDIPLPEDSDDDWNMGDNNNDNSNIPPPDFSHLNEEPSNDVPEIIDEKRGTKRKITDEHKRRYKKCAQWVIVSSDNESGAETTNQPTTKQIQPRRVSLRLRRPTYKALENLRKTDKRKLIKEKIQKGKALTKIFRKNWNSLGHD